MIDTTHNNVHFLNQIIDKISRSGVIDTETINPHDLCYQCSKHCHNFYLLNRGLIIVMMNHILPKKINIKSNTNEYVV